MSPNGHPPIQPATRSLDALRRFDACTLSNAIERFGVRPRNEGFLCGPPCRFPALPPVTGYAVTGRIRTYMPPVTGKCYFEQIEWWEHVAAAPLPRIVVLQDFDHLPGFGALFGEVHARIFRALGCVAYITNGAVRDLDGVEATGVQVFAGHVAVSHAYAHIVDFGEPIEVGGVEVKPGDILHGDRHGVLSVPAHVVEQLPAVADEILAEERDLFRLTDSPAFSVEALGARLQQFSEKRRC